MNIFVLCTGRCGSVTFSRACSHVTNYSSGHETQVKRLGVDRVAFPDRHIEIDNRLTWFLGWLEERYGDRAMYVHLTRDTAATARSFNKRWHMRGSIMRAYAEFIRMTSPKDPLAMCEDYVDAVNANIRAFLRDKTHSMSFPMEKADTLFPAFWKSIGAEGNLDAALAEWSVAHNSSH